MNAVDKTHQLFAAQAHNSARIRELMGQRHLSLVTPELEAEMTRANQLEKLIDQALEYLVLYTDD
jgi:hypothetical protein